MFWSPFTIPAPSCVLFHVETSPWSTPTSLVLPAIIQVILQGPVQFNLVNILLEPTVSRTLRLAQRIQKHVQEIGPAFRGLLVMVEKSKFSEVPAQIKCPILG